MEPSEARRHIADAEGELADIKRSLEAARPSGRSLLEQDPQSEEVLRNQQRLEVMLSGLEELTQGLARLEASHAEGGIPD